MVCCRYRVLHQRPARCQQRAGVLWHSGYTAHPRRRCRVIGDGPGTQARPGSGASDQVL